MKAHTLLLFTGIMLTLILLPAAANAETMDDIPDVYDALLQEAQNGDAEENTVEVVEDKEENVLKSQSSSDGVGVNGVSNQSKDAYFDLFDHKELRPKGFAITEGSGIDDDGYIYYTALNYNNKDLSKIVKMHFDSKKGPVIDKVSGQLKINHGNDYAYNPNDGYLYTVNNKNKNDVLNKKITKIDRKKLKPVKTTTPKYDANVAENCTKAQFKKVKGFSGITYNREERQYAFLVSDYYDILITDEQFRALNYIESSEKKSSTVENQGMDSNEEYIITAHSEPINDNQAPRRLKAVLKYYHWDGRFERSVTISGITQEIESLFHTDSTVYIVIYNYNNLTCDCRTAYLYELTKDVTEIATKKVSLNKSSLFLKIGDTYQLKDLVLPENATYQKVFYNSKNKNIATVTSKGLIKVVNSGGVNITATTADGRHTAKCVVRVKPPEVKLKIQPKKRFIKLTWNRESKKCSGYVIQRKVNHGRYSVIATVGKDKNTYRDYNVKVGKHYYYRIYTYKQYIREKIKRREYSNCPEKSQKDIVFVRPTKIKAIHRDGNKVSLVWKKCKKATGYIIQYSTTKKFKEYATIKIKGKKKTRYAFSLAKKGYYIRMMAYIKKGGKIYRSRPTKVRRIP